jgi:hypothetical protein
VVFFLFTVPDRHVTAALIVMATIAVTNYSVVFFSCYGLSVYGVWLSQNHPRDLWCIQLLVSLI